jgi:hypothetical protein
MKWQKNVIWLGLIGILLAAVPAGAQGLCASTGLTCFQNQPQWGPGDRCYFGVMCCNGHPDDPVEGELTVIMELAGFFWFWPSWGSYDYEIITIPACSCETLIIMDFILPDDPIVTTLAFYGHLIIEGTEYNCNFEL